MEGESVCQSDTSEPGLSANVEMDQPTKDAEEEKNDSEDISKTQPEVNEDDTLPETDKDETQTKREPNDVGAEINAPVPGHVEPPADEPMPMEIKLEGISCQGDQSTTNEGSHANEQMDVCTEDENKISSANGTEEIGQEKMEFKKEEIEATEPEKIKPEEVLKSETFKQEVVQPDNSKTEVNSAVKTIGTIANLVAVAANAEDDSSSSSEDDGEKVSSKETSSVKTDQAKVDKTNGASKPKTIIGDAKVASKPRRRIVTERLCVNPNCTTSGKSNQDNLVTAKTHVIGHFGVKLDKTKKRKVCLDCLESADMTLNRMLQKFKAGNSILDEKLPIPVDAMVTLDDSDQEMKTDSSSESELEFSVSNSSDEDNVQAGVNLVRAFVLAEVERHAVEQVHIDGTVDNLIRRMENLMPDAKERDKELDEIEKMVDVVK